MCNEVTPISCNFSERKPKTHKDRKVVVSSCLSGMRKISLIANANQGLALQRQILKAWVTDENLQSGFWDGQWARTISTQLAA